MHNDGFELHNFMNYLGTVFCLVKVMKVMQLMQVQIIFT